MHLVKKTKPFSFIYFSYNHLSTVKLEEKQTFKVENNVGVAIKEQSLCCWSLSSDLL